MSTDENLTSAEIIKRFNHFYDCWLDSITVTYAKGTAVRLRFCAVDRTHVDGGWEKAATDDVWRYVTVTLEDISDSRPVHQHMQRGSCSRTGRQNRARHRGGQRQPRNLRGHRRGGHILYRRKRHLGAGPARRALL